METDQQITLAGIQVTVIAAFLAAYDVGNFAAAGFVLAVVGSAVATYGISGLPGR